MSIAAKEVTDQILALIFRRGSINALEFADAIKGEIQGALDRAHAFWSVQEKVAKSLREAILKHRDQTTGHGMCWENDLKLWGAVAPRNRPSKPPPWAEFMTRCVAYRASRELDSGPVKFPAAATVKGTRKQVLTRLEDQLSQVNQRDSMSGAPGWDADSDGFCAGERSALQTAIDSLKTEWE